MKKQLIILSVLIIGISYILSRSIEIQPTSTPVFIGQQIDVELDFTEYQPDNVFFLGDRSISRLEIIAFEEIYNRPWHYLLRIAVFDTGFVETERMPLYLAGSTLIDTLFIEPFRLQVLSTLTPADTLLKDIAHPISFNLKFFDYAIPLLSVLIVLLLLYYIFKKFKRKKDIEKVYIDDRPAWLIAFELLQAFKQKRYLQNGLYLDYYYELSLIFRIFIEKQFNIKAAEMTTNEIKLALPDLENKKEIINILSAMDMIKYAKTIPVIKSSQDKLHWIEKYILSKKKNENTKGVNDV